MRHTNSLNSRHAELLKTGGFLGILPLSYLSAKILGHAQARDEQAGTAAPAPPGHQQEAFNMV